MLMVFLSLCDFHQFFTFIFFFSIFDSLSLCKNNIKKKTNAQRKYEYSKNDGCSLSVCVYGWPPSVYTYRLAVKSKPVRASEWDQERIAFSLFTNEWMHSIQCMLYLPYTHIERDTQHEASLLLMPINLNADLVFAAVAVVDFESENLLTNTSKSGNREVDWLWKCVMRYFFGAKRV